MTLSSLDLRHKLLLLFTGIAVTCLLGFILILNEAGSRARVGANVKRLLDADTIGVPGILAEMKPEWPRYKQALQAEWRVNTANRRPDASPKK